MAVEAQAVAQVFDTVQNTLVNWEPCPFFTSTGSVHFKNHKKDSITFSKTPEGWVATYETFGAEQQNLKSGPDATSSVHEALASLDKKLEEEGVEARDLSNSEFPHVDTVILEEGDDFPLDG